MKKHVKRVLMGLMAASFALSHVTMAAADEVSELKALVGTLMNRVDELEKKVGQYEAKEKQQQMKVSHVERKIDDVAEELDEVKMSSSSEMGEVFNGIDIGLGMTTIYQFTDNANGDSLSQNGEDVGDASWSLDLELSKSFEDYGSAYMLLEAGQGGGVDEELAIFSPVNFDATGGDAKIEMVEGWYEHYIDDTTMTFGKLDGTIYIDTNAYANDEGGQFLGNMFRNNSTVQFPDNGAGVRLAHVFNDHFEVETVVMDGNGDWEDIFDGPFVAVQTNVKPGLSDQEGNYRFYGWSSNQDHTKFVDTASSENANFGFGLSFDQELTDLIGIFARYGYQNPEVYLTGGDAVTIEHAYSIGMQLAGEPWGREDDVFGLAFGQAIPSDDYKNANSGLKADTESHIEAYYNIFVNDHLSVSPMVHVIVDPYGNDATNGDKTIVVGGVRSQVDF
ncbi:MAG: carbohydrate porin [Candidatus Omnitrophica bacterium]|nr:carbohydrate porin [Candidatus Omnitrophota bacterium]